MKELWRKSQSVIAATFLFFASAGVLRGADDAQTVVHRALDLVENREARQAVAVLADAARRYPEDRKLGGLLYTLLRDKRWPVLVTLPVKLPTAITSIEFSPDAKLAIAGAEDGTVRVLDTETGKLLDGTVKHPGAIVGVAIYPGNELAFSVGKAGYARIWKIADGMIVREWSNKESNFTAYAISKDWQRVALGYENGDVKVYDRETGNQVGETVKHSKRITGLVFAPEVKMLGTASADGTARVWEYSTGKARDFVVKHKAPLTGVDIGRLGILLLTSSEDGIAKVVNAKDGKPITGDVDCGAGILDAHLGASGTYFNTVLKDHTVRIWDSQTGQPVHGVIRTDDGIVSADWGPAGLSIVTASDGPLAYTWRVRDGRRIGEGMLHQSSVRIAVFGPQSRRIATGCADGTVRIWRLDTGASSDGRPSIRTHDGPVRTAFFSADGKGLVSCAHDLTMIRWNLGNVRPVGRKIPYEGKPVCAVYSPDRTFVATVTEDGKAFLVDGPSGDPRGEPRDLGGPGRWVDFHKDGKHFVTTTDRKAVVWSVADAAPVGAPIEHPDGPDRDLRMARFSPDGKLIVTAGADGTARVWDMDSRKEVAVLKKHDGAVTSARFSFDGKMLVTTAVDGEILVWDTAKWETTGTPIVLPGEIWSAVIGPNNQFVAATSQLSEGVRYFEISTGRAFTEGIDMYAEAMTVDLHPSGDTIAIAGTDGNVRTYGSPWVEEDIPKWMPEFAEKIVAMRMDGPDKFAPVMATYDELKKYPPADTAANSDFGRLAKWSVTYGIDRTASPRTFATIESNVVRRVAERSLDALYELFEAAPANPLLFAAMSLYIPAQRQGEYLAEYALARADDNPLARAYVASTFAKYGRMEEAERIMAAAVAAAPNDQRVLRRAGKLDARQNRKEAAIEKMERAVAANPNDEVTYRDYGWVLYNLHEPAKAFEQFKKADDLAGGADQDIGAGLCLSAAEMGDHAAATARYKRLIKMSAEWGDADHLKQLTGWTEKELKEMERIRALAMKR